VDIIVLCGNKHTGKITMSDKEVQRDIEKAKILNELHPQQAAGYLKQARLLRMELAILVILPLLFDVLTDCCLTHVLPYWGDVVAIRPKLASPQLLFDLGDTVENLTRRNAFDRSHNLGRTIGRNQLDKKMHMILIGPNLQENNFVSFGNLQTNVFQFLIHFGAKHHTPVFRWTHNMIDQDGYIMAFANQLTHCEILSDGSPIGKPISSAASCGECTLTLLLIQSKQIRTEKLVG
jgi:hypothetical protein